MFLTQKILEENRACNKGKEFIKQKYPNGADLSIIIMDADTPMEMLHWGAEHLPHSQKEHELYLQRINNINSTGCYQSSNVFNSSFVSRSDNISNSQRIFTCKNISESFDVVSSDDITNSSQIFVSDFITDSKKIFNGHNIEQSENIINSSFVVNSKNIYASLNIFDSQDLRESNDMTNCHFCANCSALTNALFCWNVSNKENFIFNKQIDLKRFNIIVGQYQKIIGAGMQVAKNWPQDMVHKKGVSRKTDIFLFYSELSDRFYYWVKTLPGYDQKLFETIIGENTDLCTQ